MKHYIFSALLIILISLFTLKPSFNLSLFGDDWLAFWRYEKMAGEFSQGYFNPFSYFFTLYGSQDVTMGLLWKFFGYNSSYYYYLSYALRIVAAFSLYPLIIYLTKNKLSAFFAILFFSVTTIGLETTNWVFNMPTYLMIIFLNLFLYFFLRSKDSENIKFLLISAVLFFVTIAVSPIRSTGVFPFVLTVEFIWLLKSPTFLSFKKTFLGLSLLALIFVGILSSTVYYFPSWDNPNISKPEKATLSNIINSIKTSFQLIQAGNFDFILNPVVSIGNMFIPDNIILGQNRLLPLIFGGFALIFWLYLIKLFFKTKLGDALIISLTWTIFSFLLPWIRNPTFVFPTTHRYLIVSVIGISIFLSIIISFGKNRKTQATLSLLILLLIVVHMHSTHKFLKHLESVRNQQLSDKIWSQIPKIPVVKNSKDPLVFYFTGENGEIIFNVINFGFPLRMALLYKLDDYTKIVVVGSFEEITSAVKDGKSLTIHALPEQPTPIENIYTFHLEGRDKLINTTERSREKLTKI